MAKEYAAVAKKEGRSVDPAKDLSHVRVVFVTVAAGNLLEPTLMPKLRIGHCYQAPCYWPHRESPNAIMHKKRFRPTTTSARFLEDTVRR